MPTDPATPAKPPSASSAVDPAAARAKAANTRPLGVYVVSVVLALQALALGFIAVTSIISAFTSAMASAASGVFFIVLLLGLTAGLAAVAVNAFRGMRWTRSAAFVWQLLMLAIGVPALLESNFFLGAAMVVPAIATAYFLFTPRVVEFSQRNNSQTPVL